MRAETFCDIFGDIRQEYIQEARDPVPTRRRRWPQFAAAACLCLVVGGAALALLPGSPLYRDAGSGGLPNGMWPEGLDPVTASLAVHPATEDVRDVAAATYEKIDESTAYSFEGLGEHLPTWLPEGLSFYYAALYETTMKDGTQYHLLRAFYTDGEVIPGIQDGDTEEQMPDQLHDALAVFVMDYEPDTKKTIHQREDLPAFLERDWDGSTFHFACGEVYIGVTVNSGGDGLSTKDILPILNSIQ